MDCFEIKRIQPESITAAPSSSSKSENIQKRNNQNNGIAGTNGNQRETVSKAVPLTTPEDFLCLDFTVDLDIACDKRGTLRLFASVQCSAVLYCKVRYSAVLQVYYSSFFSSSCSSLFNLSPLSPFLLSPLPSFLLSPILLSPLFLSPQTPNPSHLCVGPQNL